MQTCGIGICKCVSIRACIYKHVIYTQTGNLAFKCHSLLLAAFKLLPIKGEAGYR